MEFSISDVISIIGLLAGGGGVGFLFTWRYSRRRERAEAKTAEVDMAQKVQDTYQQMLDDKNKEVEDNKRLIEELREDRDHYKKDRDELRNELEKLSKQFLQFKMDDEKEKIAMKRDIARNGRMVECMRPFLCGLAPECKKCVPVTISATGELENTVRTKTKKKEIEPINHDEL